MKIENFNDVKQALEQACIDLDLNDLIEHVNKHQGPNMDFGYEFKRFIFYFRPVKDEGPVYEIIKIIHKRKKRIIYFKSLINSQINDNELTLAELREYAGLSVGTVAKELNITKRTLLDYENGTHILNILLIVKLSKLYNVTVEEVLYGAMKSFFLW